MKKSTKGALAAVAAGVLLLGGAGTLAFWSDSASVDAGTISAGELKLDDGTCDSDWVYAPGNAQEGATVTTIVPGDEIVKECEFVVTARGDNLQATPSVPTEITYTQTGGDENPASTLSLTAAATYTIDGGAVTTITEANDGQTLAALITVSFPFGTESSVNANDTQNLVAELDDLTISLTQDEL